MERDTPLPLTATAPQHEALSGQQELESSRAGSLRPALYQSAMQRCTAALVKVSGRASIEGFSGRYFFMACLMKNSMGYRALGFWAEQQSNEWHDDEPLSDYVVTIDELEKLTGIDFFCNLPDNIEKEVESKVALKAWGL